MQQDPKHTGVFRLKEQNWKNWSQPSGVSPSEEDKTEERNTQHTQLPKEAAPTGKALDVKNAAVWRGQWIKLLLRMQASTKSI